MDRLTYSGVYGVDVVGTEGRTCLDICASFKREFEDCDDCPIYAVMERLASYEDTGLTPKEIEGLKAGMNDTLEPCPFCGGKAEITGEAYRRGEYSYRIYCKGCGAVGSLFYDTPGEAIAVWNRRVNGKENEPKQNPENSG